MIRLKEKFSWVQIKALLKKDILVRLRQPWMTIVQFVWPCVIFIALYTLRDRFQPQTISECQFPSRILPAKNHLLPFFHSYICTIENSCLSSGSYEEYSTFQNAPLKPVLNIVQTFLNEDTLYNAVVDLPEKMNFVTAATAIVTHPKFSYMEQNVNDVIARLPEVEKMLGGNFDIKQLFADNRMFSKSGNIICGKPFPRSDNIRFVNNILYSEDFNGANKDELEVMPTKYCKQLYLDVTTTNNGKITWSHIIPIIQGKIIYGPITNDTKEIMKFANSTFEELGKLRTFAGAINTVMIKLRTDDKFKSEFFRLLDLVKSPLIQMAFGDSINLQMIEEVVNRIVKDEVVADVFRTVYNILECFATDRFIPVESETALEDKAFELSKKKLFYAGIYFNKTTDKDIAYKFRMDVDNTPITSENRNRFWFPGPDSSFELDMRYHRGFVQIKHAVDIGIIKAKKMAKKLIEAPPITTDPSADDDDNWFFNTANDDFDDDENFNTTDLKIDVPPAVDLNGTNSMEADEELGNSTNIDNEDENWNFEDEETEQNKSDIRNVSKERRKRSPQFGGGFLSFLLGGGGKKDNSDKFEVDDIVVHTKQFPYPEYTKDDFKKGLYLAQSVQMAFFIALIVQIATCIRYRIWMKESRNTMLMHAMGLKESSEILTWLLITFIELAIVFVMCCFILYTGQIMQYTDLVFLFLFLVLFGLCVISFCYMCSTFFNSASIGSVASAILFLITFMPYIIIISLGTTLSGFSRFLTNLSFSTAFCYAWNVIMRLELQDKGMSLGGGSDSEFRYAVFMMFLDMVIYAVIGFVVERIKDDEFKFHKVERDDLDANVGCVLQNVSKVYPPTKVAVSNVSLVFPKDNVTCLLGRNGAGKSTIIKMLTGQIRPTSGHLALSQSLCDGLKMDQIGLCSQDNILIPHLTAKEHLEMYARVKLSGGFELEVARTMKSLNFGKYENYEARKLSGGYQRRLCVAIAFIGSPNLVILDEPCSGVDIKARRNVWELVESLRKGRAVVLATHYLDEAEYLGDSVLIMNQGRVIAEHSPESLKKLFTNAFELTIACEEENNSQTVETIQSDLLKYIENPTITQNPETRIFEVKVPYIGSNGEPNRCSELMQHLENLQAKNQIRDISISSKNLEEVFNTLNKEKDFINGDLDDKYEKIDLSKNDHATKDQLTQIEIIRNLLWKRLQHFRRNYRLLICILVLPTIFEIIAMGFLQIRPVGEHEKILKLSKNLYDDSTDFLSYETSNQFGMNTYNKLRKDCKHCEYFNNSEKAYLWLLDTFEEYQMSRYAGLSFNDSRGTVWYNNKGYHSMIGWLNDLNSHMLKAEMNDTDYSISSYNHPLNLGQNELSRSSILQQVADSGISLIILIAFSLVVAGGSVFIVNERANGEKLQQMLCGVKVETYWGVALLWDMIIYLLAMLFCVIIFEIFAIPTYVAKSNLDGICLLLVLYGFASIPAVHVFEKIFSEASFANMTIFCLNVVIALTTTTVIILFDVLGESDEAESWRNFLNRAFLIFPQHALSDGLITICKNFIVSELFSRYYINTYKSPVSSEILQPHFVSLFILGVFFMALNYCIETGYLRSLYRRVFRKNNGNNELQIVSIQNSLKRDDKYSSYSDNYVLKVENLFKVYGNKDYAVKNVSFRVKTGECFGLLGNNGAGKSTIFKILSGQMSPTSGTVDFYNKNISYCPQTSALDPLLTVKEVIQFYGTLRKIKDISRLTASTLKSFNLEDYKDVLVKNLSGGNRRKLNVAVSCFGDTNIVLMDEPTSDMDPVTRSLVYHAISELISERRSVVLTSHTISEIDRVCHRITVLKDGKIITTGTPEHLKEQFGGYYNVTIFYDKIEALSMEREITQEFSQCRDLQVHPHSMKFVVKVKLKQNDNENNEIVEDDGCLTLSELFTKLSRFCEERSILYTITKCKLDKVFENILESNDGGCVHKGFVQTETVA